MQHAAKIWHLVILWDANKAIIGLSKSTAILQRNEDGGRAPRGVITCLFRVKRLVSGCEAAFSEQKQRWLSPADAVYTQLAPARCSFGASVFAWRRPRPLFSPPWSFLSALPTVRLHLPTGHRAVFSQPHRRTVAQKSCSKRLAVCPPGT